MLTEAPAMLTCSYLASFGLCLACPLYLRSIRSVDMRPRPFTYPPRNHSWKCTVQGWARVYFSLVEFALVTAITLTCYLMVVRQQFHIQEVSAGCTDSWTLRTKHV